VIAAMPGARIAAARIVKGELAIDYVIPFAAVSGRDGSTLLVGRYLSARDADDDLTRAEIRGVEIAGDRSWTFAATAETLERALRLALDDEAWWRKTLE
jgi:hypothetical protein